MKRHVQYVLRQAHGLKIPTTRINLSLASIFLIFTRSAAMGFKKKDYFSLNLQTSYCRKETTALLLPRRPIYIIRD